MKSKLTFLTPEQLVKEVSKIDTDLILVVVDHNIGSLYGKIINFQEMDNKRVIVWKAPDGEKVKNIKEYESCMEYFLDKGIHRKAHLIAFGGGATSDFAGFVASTLLRGIKWSVIPTTLLSMVDAAIGGKVAINSKLAKNLIGSFHVPTNIWMCHKFLETLNSDETLSGKGEIIKYALIDKNIFQLIQNESPLDKIIEACANYKLELTEKDIKEEGIRKTLNYGHTFGHALEKIYNLPHGVAVMWGMAVIDTIYNNGQLIPKMKELRAKLGMPSEKSPWINREFPVDKVLEFIKKDKKVVSNVEIDIVNISQVGNVKIEKINLDKVSQDALKVTNELKLLSF